jgi:hypothetical protein
MVVAAVGIVSLRKASVWQAIGSGKEFSENTDRMSSQQSDSHEAYWPLVHVKVKNTSPCQ